MLTAEWENHLRRIERGELTAEDFMISIGKFVGDTVKTHASATEEYKALFPAKSAPIVHSGEVLGLCPRCKGNVYETPKAYSCENTRDKKCEFAIWKNSKFFEAKQKTLTKGDVKALLTDGRVFMSGLYSPKTGKTYNATITLEDEGKGYTKFGMEFGNEGKKS
jgi:DNA topoisomerase-3